MANISNEQPPQDVEEFLKEYLTRRFVEINIALAQSKKFPPIYVIPAKPQAGNVEFFGRAIGDITFPGFWGYTGTLWIQLDAAGGGGGSGQVNTSSNLGSGEFLASAKVGFDLPFKSLLGGSNVGLTATANSVTINSTDTVYDDTAIQAEVDLNTAKVTNVAHPLVETAVPLGAIFTDTVYDDTAIQAEVDLNTAKVTNVVHPLVETAVPIGAVFTDTVYTLTKAAVEAVLTGVISTHSHAGGGGSTDIKLISVGINDAQSVNSATDTAMNFNTEDIKDTGFTHSTSTNPSRIEVDADGRYKITGFITINGSQSNYRYNARVAVRVNGTTTRQYIDSGYIRATNGHNECSLNLLDVMDLTAGDYIEVMVARMNTTSGNAVTTVNKTKVIMEKVA